RFRRSPAILRSRQSRRTHFATTKLLARLLLWGTYEISSSASVCCGARCCPFCSAASFGLLLPWTVLPILLPRPLLPILRPRTILPISLSRALLSEPELGRRRQWACRLLSLLVNGLLCALRSPFFRGE